MRMMCCFLAKKNVFLMTNFILSALLFVNGHTLYSSYKEEHSQKHGQEGFYVWNKDKKGHLHRGGFVSTTASIKTYIDPVSQKKVTDGIYLGEDAVVLDQAKIAGQCFIDGEIIIKDHVKIFGIAKITGKGTIQDRVKIFDSATVDGVFVISGRARLFQRSKITGVAKIHDTLIKNRAQLVGEHELMGRFVLTQNLVGCHKISQNKQTKKIPKILRGKVCIPTTTRQESCMICLNSFANTCTKPTVELIACHHQFHAACFLKWHKALSNHLHRCPICRAFY